MALKPSPVSGGGERGNTAGKAGPRTPGGGCGRGRGGGGGRLPPRYARPLRSGRTAVPGAPAHAHSGRWAGGAVLTSSTDAPPNPLAEGRWPRRLPQTDSRTDRGRRDGRTARPCPGRLPAPSCCCPRQAGRGPAQVRPGRSPACVYLRRRPSLCPCPLSTPLSLSLYHLCPSLTSPPPPASARSLSVAPPLCPSSPLSLLHPPSGPFLGPLPSVPLNPSPPWPHSGLQGRAWRSRDVLQEPEAT